MPPASRYKIEGLWTIDCDLFGELCILVILPEGRAVQFPTSVTLPRINQTMRLWYSDYDGKRVRFRGTLSDCGWWRGVEPKDIGWIMTAEDDGESHRFHCTPLDQKNLPEWYDKMLEKNLRLIEEAGRQLGLE